MLDGLASTPSDAPLQADARWHALIDELLSGGRSEQSFIDEVSREEATAPDAPWSALAALDQRFRLGHVSEEMYRAIGAKISQLELGRHADGVTVNLRTHRWRIARGRKLPATLTTPQAHAFVGPSIRHAPVPKFIEPGRVLRGRYVLVSHLGSGGMGTVYKALDRLRANLREDGRYVAVKILHEAVDDEEMTQLRREFFCAQALSHPHIVKVFELDRDDDVAFFTMELLDGRLLSTHIEEVRPRALPRTVAWIVIRDVGSALAYAHSRKVVHGDLKPQNIMITEQGEVRILDFGASSDPMRLRPLDGAETADEEGELTPAYAASERLEGGRADSSADLYALACLSYELLAGEHPFAGHTATEARTLRLTPPRPAGLNDRQWGALMQVLSGSPEQRSGSVADWVADMMPAPTLLTAGLTPHLGSSTALADAATPGPAASTEQASLEGKDLDLAGAAKAMSDGRKAIFVCGSVTLFSPAEPPSAILVQSESTLVDAGRMPPGHVSLRLPAAPQSITLRPAPLSPPPFTTVPAKLLPKMPALPAPSASELDVVATETASITSGPTSSGSSAIAAAAAQMASLDAPPVTGLPAALRPQSIEISEFAHYPAFLPPRPVSPRSNLMPNSTLLVALLICATVWAAISKPWSGARLASEPPPSSLQVFTHLEPMHVLGVEAALPLGLLVAAPPRGPERAARGTPSPPPAHQLRFSADSYRLRPGERFAELHIVRSAGWDGEAEFVWWTEGGNAHPGADYLPQNPATQFMSKAQRRASLFVKVPDAARHERRVFFVAMTDPRGRSMSGITRVQVSLPPQRRSEPPGLTAAR